MRPGSLRGTRFLRSGHLCGESPWLLVFQRSHFTDASVETPRIFAPWSKSQPVTHPISFPDSPRAEHGAGLAERVEAPPPHRWLSSRTQRRSLPMSVRDLLCAFLPSCRSVRHARALSFRVLARNRLALGIAIANPAAPARRPSSEPSRGHFACLCFVFPKYGRPIGSPQLTRAGFGQIVACGMQWLLHPPARSREIHDARSSPSSKQR